MKMIRNLLFAVRMFIALQKSRDGVYEQYEGGQLYFNSKL